MGEPGSLGRRALLQETEEVSPAEQVHAGGLLPGPGLRHRDPREAVLVEEGGQCILAHTDDLEALLGRVLAGGRSPTYP